jgi:hypothetical protein
MIYATSPAEIDERRRAFIRKWRLKCKAVADSLEEAGDRLFTFTRLPSAVARPGERRLEFAFDHRLDELDRGSVRYLRVRQEINAQFGGSVFGEMV